MVADDTDLLLRRAGFGPTSAQLEAARRAGYAATVAALTAPTGPDIGATSTPAPELGPDPYVRDPNPSPSRRIAADDTRRAQLAQISRWWLDRMTVADHQAMERLHFFWHGHWATGALKVKSAHLMLTQHNTLRNRPDFVTMARRMVVDPALVYWLDGQLNTKQAPNENLARELFELFVLGIGNYTETDVKQAGRALTGWRLDLARQRCVFDARSHDNGPKTILGHSGDLGARELVDLLVRHEACPRFIAARLWLRYGSSSRPIPETTREKMVAAFPSPAAMLAALFTDDEFRATRATMVKQPVEWLVGAMRQLGVRLAHAPADTVTQILEGLSGLGQRPFDPPSVGGWPSGAAWLTSAAAQVRLSLAGKLAALIDPGQLTPESVAYILCIDTWTDRTYAVLRDVQNSRLLLTLGLVSPEYLVT